MKHNFLKILLIAFSSLLAAVGIAIACGWEGGYYVGYTSNFSPEIVAGKGYSPLFYAPHDFFYGIVFDEEHNNRFSKDVTDEWYDFLNKKISKENIKTLLLTDTIYDELNNLAEYIRDGKESAVAAKWRKVIPLNDKKIQEFILFANVAVYVDKVAAPTRTNYWNYSETQQTDADISDDLIEYFIAKYDSETGFLKNRYWFLTLKAAFYAKKYKNFEAFFEKTKRATEKNTLYYRALGYLAAIKLKAKEYKQANIFYAEIFDKVPSMSPVVAYSFHLEDESQWAQTLKMASTVEQKVSLWTMLGYFKDEERAIREIINLDPKSRHLDLLLTRLVNKAESKANMLAYENVENKPVDPEIFELIRKTASDKKISNQFLWNSAAGYLCTLNENYRDAEKYFAQAERNYPPAKPLAKEQLRLLRFVNQLSSIKSIKGDNIEKLAGELSWLYNMRNTKPEDLRYTFASEQSKKYIAEMYDRDGNTFYSELFNHDDKFYANPHNIDLMLSFLQKRNKSPLEKVMQEIYPITIQDLYQYKAVMAAFNDDLDSAIEFMRKTDELASVELLGNPFNGFIKDCNDCDHRRRQTVKYSRLSVLHKMREMKQNVEQKNDVFNNALLLGNAYYSITFYGNARLFWWNENLIHYYIPSVVGYIPCFAQRMLTDMSMAQKYYSIAFDAAENDEQRAKATYLLAKCERNDFYNEHFTLGVCDSQEINHSNYGISIEPVTWSKFEELKNNYAHTKYYKDVINECGDFKKYVSSN